MNEHSWGGWMRVLSASEVVSGLSLNSVNHYAVLGLNLKVGAKTVESLQSNQPYFYWGVYKLERWRGFEPRVRKPTVGSNPTSSTILWRKFMNPLYTVSRVKKDNIQYGPMHGSMNGKTTLCEQIINHNWMIHTNDFSGQVTCKRCKFNKWHTYQISLRSVPNLKLASVETIM